MGASAIACVAFWANARLGLFPPDSDPAYYVLGTRSLLAGRGLAVDVVWNFLATVPGMPQPGFELWVPGTSVVLALGQWLLGPSYPAACTIAAVFGAIATALCIIVAKRLLDHDALALACGGLFVLNERLMLHATTPDSTVFYTAWILGAILSLDAAIGQAPGRRRDGLLICFGLLGAAAALTRNDALLVVPLTVVIASAASIRQRTTSWLSLRDAAVAGSAFALGLVPWMTRCWLVFGTPWAPASGRTPWLRDYHHLFAYPPDVTFTDYVAYVRAAPLDVVQGKARALYHLLYWTADLVTVVAVPLVMAGAYLSLRRKRI
ncbi:MAG: hypothetical protein ACOC1F_04500, partial [Myxococcota bacterium]